MISEPNAGVAQREYRTGNEGWPSVFGIMLFQQRFASWLTTNKYEWIPIEDQWCIYVIKRGHQKNGLFPRNEFLYNLYQNDTLSTLLVLCYKN